MSKGLHLGALSLTVVLCGPGCSPADVRCNAQKLIDDHEEGSNELFYAEDAGSLELSDRTLTAVRYLTLRITGLSKLGFSRVGEDDSSVSVRFETQYLESVPPGAEEPEVRHSVRVKDGVVASAEGNFTTHTELEVPIFGCETESDLGVDNSCCKAGEKVCELEISVITSRYDWLFPATVTSYSAEAQVELLGCEEQPKFKVELIPQEAN